jgi:hypothetical protein
VSGQQLSYGEHHGFSSFAEQVYTAAPDIYLARLPLEASESFMLPALYGGEAAGSSQAVIFDYLVVLEAPSVSFTRKRWKAAWSVQCATADEAVHRHRQIFFEWAYLEPQAELFRALIRELSTTAEFFRRLYITDIWKDAAFQTNRKRSNFKYQRYWRDVLALEFSRVPTKAIIFVGRQARDYGWDLVPPGTPRYHVPFPKRTERFRVGLKRLTRELRGDKQDECGTDQRLDAQPGTTLPRLGLNIASRIWTLNDSVNHNVFNFIPDTPRHIQMSLFYQRARGNEKSHIGATRLDLEDLVENGLARQADRRVWLRFVHDTRDHGIYIQLNGGSPRRLFGRVPAGAMSSVT